MGEEEAGNVTYECVRCGARVTKKELEAYLDIKCICGYRVFRKVRSEIVKQVPAV